MKIQVVPLLMDLLNLMESSNQQMEKQLNRYAEDFGVLFSKYLNTKAQLTEALADSNCRLFNDHLGRSQTQRLDMETGLRCALAQGHFRLVYQPQVNPTDGHIIGVEALLRWDWPDHGTILPDRFIPIAEKIGLILPISQWVLHTACLQFASWRRDGSPPPRVAVNISARQINDPAFVQFVAAVIAETGMHPGELEIEITESQLMDNLELAVANLVRLRKLGVLIAIDDFGTGYSSLGSLCNLPIDRIKVDRSFIDDIDRNPDAYAITTAIFGMAKALRLGAIAEGIERESQAKLLSDIQCNEFQGNLYGNPQPPEVIAARLKQQQENYRADTKTVDR
jgi:EAL domain-containing protein (putative c-di-GMP-specific phosphodiesterase class I)